MWNTLKRERTKYYYGEYAKHSEEWDHFPEVLWMKMLTNCEKKWTHDMDFTVIWLTSLQSPKNCHMAAAIVEDLNVFFYCFRLQSPTGCILSPILVSQFLLLDRVDTYHHCIHEVAPNQGINAARSPHQSAVWIKDGAAQRPLWGKKNPVSQKQENQVEDIEDFEKAALEKTQIVLVTWHTCQDACHVNHPHFEPLVDQFQRDSQ